MVYLYYISSLRYTILVGNPRFEKNKQTKNPKQTNKQTNQKKPTKKKKKKTQPSN